MPANPPQPTPEAVPGAEPGEQPSQAASETALVAPAPGRGAVVRSYLVFQLKLLIDGLKDMLLSPLSLLVLIVGLISPKRAEAGWARLFSVGRAFDHWLNLFPEPIDEGALGRSNADTLFSETENLLVALRRGGTSDPAVRAKLASMARAIEKVSPGIVGQNANRSANADSSTEN